MAWSSIKIWLCFAAFAVLNGAFREKILTRKYGDLKARFISTIMLSTVIFLITLLYFLKMHLASVPLPNPWALGALWSVLTLAFECLVGRFVMGATWDALLQEYNVFQGRSWPLVLITVLFSPVVANMLVNHGG
jgi:hypothetical protein